MSRIFTLTSRRSLIPPQRSARPFIRHAGSLYVAQNELALDQRVQVIADGGRRQPPPNHQADECGVVDDPARPAARRPPVTAPRIRSARATAGALLQPSVWPPLRDARRSPSTSRRSA